MELPFDDQGKRKRKMPEPSSSSSPARTNDKQSFDVFLSFRGEDTRKGFTGHLYNALRQCGISTFIDSEELERGERIEELFHYIEASKIFVSVLSKGYADSRWCLREITKMVECGRLIIPIFFDVNPTDVGKQSGPFEAAFQKHESSERVREEELRKWKDALRAVAEISGYVLENDTNGDQAQLIQKVVKQISRKLNKNARTITEHLVGMDSHIHKIYRLLDAADKEVKMIGIVGMGGIGKTTIATVVYNKLLSHFDDSSFISNVRENFKQHNGGVTLQKRLIKDILKDEHPDVADVEQGKGLIQERFCSKRVLVILDDADHIEQLEALAGKRNWFGSRSRIIITSRDSGVLLNHGLKEEDIYNPELLDGENSLELFISHAFPVARPTESEYVELAKKFVQVSGRLPLALTVFGSLVRRRNIKQWKEILEKLIQDPYKDVDGKLRISYDGLEKNVRQIFLDISCFFIGQQYDNATDFLLYATYDKPNKQKEYATCMWEDCGLYPETAIAELQERSLINVNKRDEFEMHDLLRDMGRGIAQQSEHWQWSRLRNLDDLLQSLAYKSRLAEGIVMDDWEDDSEDVSEVHLSTEYFIDFSRLRLLHLSGFAFKGEFLHLPKSLKWLRLSDCKFLNGLSGASNHNAISVLELIQVDDVARILMEAFHALKVLHLESYSMTRTPNFSKMKCLTKLTLQNCEMLKEVDVSIGSLNSLVHLDLQDCYVLQRLPDSICMLMSLETLILGCNRLSSLPEKLGDMKSLKELWVEDTDIRVIPDSIGDLSNLRVLSLNENYGLEKLPDSMRRLDSLEELYIDLFADRLRYHFDNDTFNLMNLDSTLHIEYAERFEWLAGLPNSALEKVKELTIEETPSYLGRLTIEDHSIQELPPYLGRLTNLEVLSIRCPKLRGLPEWLGQLRKLNSFELESDSLEAMPVMAGRMFENLRSLELNCPALKHVPDWIASLGRLEKLSLSGYNIIRFLPTSMAHLIGTLCHLDLSFTRTVSDSDLFFLISWMCYSGCSVRTLNLSHTNIRALPSSMSNLAQLEKLHLNRCENLQSLPPLPSSLHFLYARHCDNLGTISDVSNLKSLRILNLGGCRLLGDFCGLEIIAHNLETLELPGPWGGLSGFSQLSPAFMTRVFKGAAFPSLKKFKVIAIGEYCASGDDGEPTDLDGKIKFPKVGRGGKRPTLINCAFTSCHRRLSEKEEFSLSISIMEEDGHSVCQCHRLYTNREGFDRSDHSFSISGEEIAEYSREGSYLTMQISAFRTLILAVASLDVEYT